MQIVDIRRVNDPRNPDRHTWFIVEANALDMAMYGPNTQIRVAADQVWEHIRDKRARHAAAHFPRHRTAPRHPMRAPR